MEQKSRVLGQRMNPRVGQRRDVWKSKKKPEENLRKSHTPQKTETLQLIREAGAGGH